MIAEAFAAIEDIFSRPFRVVFLKTIGLTLLALVLAGTGLERLLVNHIPPPSAPWLLVVLHATAGLGIAALAILLVTPVTFAVACFFFDELADHVEAAAGGLRGKRMPLLLATATGLRFSALSLAVNACALLLLLVPGVNVVAFFGANAYLLGRGFFELAVLRYCSPAEASELRRRHGLRVLAAGCLCAALAMLPILNLLTPLFATALLVRVAQPLVQTRPPYRAV